MLAAAEAEAMLAAAESESDAEDESMLAAEGRGTLGGSSASGKRERRCGFRYCVCCWKYFPRIHRVAPGEDYVCIPAGDAGDYSPAWSLLVGVTDGASSLRVSRLRVARSGRILGRSDDELEHFHEFVLEKPPGYTFEAGAALAADGHSLCVLGKDAYDQQLSVQLDTDKKQVPLPEIEGTSHCIPICAHENIWALSATLLDDDIDSFSVVARRLGPAPGGWEQVGDPFTSQHIFSSSPHWRGGFLQGYAVLPDNNLILVSFQQPGLFLTFAPSSGRWTPVLTDTHETRSQDYLPIFGRGIYVKQHQAVCMLHDNTIYAYKLTYQQDDKKTWLLKLEPPVEIDIVCPFIPEKGYGFLTNLQDCLMCSVWISLAWDKPCPCSNLHAIVTTFHLHDLAQGGIKVLHSTLRRIDMVPNPPDQKFCFLQEYKDEGSLVLLQHEEEQDDSSKPVDEPSKMLSCCRIMKKCWSLTPCCFVCGHDGHVAVECSLQPEVPSSTIPPLGPSRSIPVDPSCPVVPVTATMKKDRTATATIKNDRPATATIKKDLFIICQAGSRSVIYQTGAMDGDDKPLQTCYVADDGDHYCHFFQSGSKIHAVSSIEDGMLELSLNMACPPFKRPVRRPTADPFVLVIRVGRETIALTETLQVFHQTQYNYGSTTWLRYTTDDSDVVRRKVVISGYVTVNDDSFIVCDAVTCSCLLFDLGDKLWRVVMPWAAFKENLPAAIHTKCLLNGRCVFIEGFIYTCRDGGLAAYELLGEGHSVYISKPIFLPFSWHIDCVGEDMCLDYAGKDVDSGSNLFYVLQGGSSLPMHGVWINTVKVKTTRTASNKMKPVRINHVASGTRFIRHSTAIVTRCCFAASCL